MKMKQVLSLILICGLLAASLTGCVTNVTGGLDGQTPTGDGGSAVTPDVVEDKTDLTEHVGIRVNYAAGNKSRTITYNQESPLTLPDGTVVIAGMLKPTWSYLETALNCDITDVTLQDQKASEMIDTGSTTNFADANLFGGNSIAEDLMYYGTEGKFVDLGEMMAQGYLPNFQRYLNENPDIRDAITAYDGNIYYAPYIAELDTFARVFNIRESWVTKLLDADGAAYDTGVDLTTYYGGFYVGDNVRAGDNGGTVTPKEGVEITKRTDQSIIELQNALAVKNGQTLTETFVQYIRDNYDYDRPSQLFLGEKAAYDIDELIALMRCIKANPGYLTDGRASVVWPMFTRQSSYREDLLRLSTYFGGVKCHSADSYGSRWYIDENGDVQYTYSTEGMYNVLRYLSQMEAEGLIYSDCYDLTNKTNFRSTLWGTDEGESPSFGFITFDWHASSTADSLNPDTVVILPPVAKVNGVWQYYIDNGRAIKPDGWAISVAGNRTEAELHRSCAVVDYFFSEEGSTLQNYGIPMMLEAEPYVGPDGISYPKFNTWTTETCQAVAKGDLSTFLRDWIGSLIPVGFQKNIGFEYQYTSQRGFAGWELLQNSTCTFATYSGGELAGENPNYQRMVPPVFSLTLRQKDAVAENTTMEQDDVVEGMFNIVRYAARGNAPDSVTIPADYSQYLAGFQARGLDSYVATYQQAYRVMTGRS